MLAAADLSCQMLFFIQKTTILRGLGMENVGTLNGHLEYFIVIWYILFQLVYFIII
jgi:hypothetical protein